MCTYKYITVRRVSVNGVSVGLFTYVTMPETFNLLCYPIDLDKFQCHQIKDPPHKYVEHTPSCININR